jgi:hypothetical protein
MCGYGAVGLSDLSDVWRREREVDAGRTIGLLHADSHWQFSSSQTLSAAVVPLSRRLFGYFSSHGVAWQTDVSKLDLAIST